jgi:uncharacterized protein (DUF4415 family)
MKHTGKPPDRRRSTDWTKLQSRTDEEIRAGIDSDPGASPTDTSFWKKAKVVLPKRKETITIRLDADLLNWLRRQKGYQTRINAILRTYMDAHRS